MLSYISTWKTNKYFGQIQDAVETVVQESA